MFIVPLALLILAAAWLLLRVSALRKFASSSPQAPTSAASEAAALDALCARAGPAADRATLLRFLRARDGQIEPALAQFEEMVAWRKLHDVDRHRRLAPRAIPARALAQHDAARVLSQLRVVRPRDHEALWLYSGQTFLTGNDRQGRPIFLQRTGLASHRFAEMFAFCGGGSAGLKAYIDGNVFGQEVQAARMAEDGFGATQTVVIMDLAGLSLSPDPRALATFREFLKINERYYPETLALHFFVNAPLAFAGLWRVVRSWLPEKTAAKFHVLGRSETRAGLLEHIAADQLPREYGGTSDVELPRDRDGCARMVEEATRQLQLLR